MTHTEKFVSIERIEQAAWIRIARPKSLNAINEAVLAELSAALQEVHNATEFRVAVITGTGRAFCAGADIGERLHDGTEIRPDDFVDFVRRVGGVFRQVEELPIPVVAAVNGVAVGGGLELAMSCDFIVASSIARLGDGHANMGGLPGYGGTARLPLFVGVQRAKYLTLTGNLIDAQRANDWGLVAEVVDVAEFEAGVQEICRAIIAKSPLGLRWIRRLIDGGTEPNVRLRLEAEVDALRDYVYSHDLREGIRAFVQKRAPEFSGE